MPLTAESLEPGADTRLPPFRRLVALFLESVDGLVAPDLPEFERGVAVHAVLAAARASMEAGAEMTVSPELGA